MHQLITLKSKIFILHIILNTLLLAISIILKNNLNIVKARYWKVNLPLLVAFILIKEYHTIITDNNKRKKIKFPYPIILLVLIVSQNFLSMNYENF